MRQLAKDIVDLKPEVILSRATPPTKALLQETKTVPIVFVVVADPVGDGLVASLARPGGNVTGFTNAEGSLGGKWLELLREISPRMSRVGAIYNPKTAPDRHRNRDNEGSMDRPVAFLQDGQTSGSLRRRH